MIIPLFLDTDDARHFPRAARDAIFETCAATEPEVRALLPSLPPTIELAARTGTWVLPQTGERGSAANPVRIDWVVDPSAHGGIAAIREDTIDKAFIDFDALDRQVFKVAEAGIAGTKVINGGGNSPSLDCLQQLNGVFVSAHHHAFGHFKFQVGGRQCGAFQHFVQCR